MVFIFIGMLYYWFFDVGLGYCFFCLESFFYYVVGLNIFEFGLYKGGIFVWFNVEEFYYFLDCVVYYNIGICVKIVIGYYGS